MHQLGKMLVIIKPSITAPSITAPSNHKTVFPELRALS